METLPPENLIAQMLALPVSTRAELASLLLHSLDDSLPPNQDRTPEEWEEIIQQRSDALHRGECESVDAQEAMARIHAAVRAASRAE